MGAILVLIVVGCALEPAGATPPAGTLESVLVSPGPSVRAAPSPSGEPSPDQAETPPAAFLAVDGGDPVPGQVGTYALAASGSDGPWLHGTPMAVGAGESLALILTPAWPIDSWQARYVPAGQPDPTGAVSLATGRGDPVLEVPPVGAWTMEIGLTFTAGAGTANYFWRLAVE
jgi:hypothetical protein